MPLLAGAALGGDLTNQTEGPEKASQLIRDPVGTSGNSLAVKTATSNCLEEFCVFLGFFATLFVFTLAWSQFYLRDVSLWNEVCVKRHVQAQGREASSLGHLSTLGDGRFRDREGITERIGKWFFVCLFVFACSQLREENKAQVSKAVLRAKEASHTVLRGNLISLSLCGLFQWGWRAGCVSDTGGRCTHRQSWKGNAQLWPSVP